MRPRLLGSRILVIKPRPSDHLESAISNDTQLYETDVTNHLTAKTEQLLWRTGPNSLSNNVRGNLTAGGQVRDVSANLSQHIS